jgi:23S rRNA (guanosine2251-2'-O)-methyltransferase
MPLTFYPIFITTVKESEEIIYGTRAIFEALNAGRKLDKLLLRKGAQGEVVDEIVSRCRQAGIPVQVVPAEKLDRTAPRDANHQGLVAFVPVLEYQDLEAVISRLQEKGATPLLVMMDSVTDVRNLGAIARTAEVMGAHALVVPEQGSARINSDAMKVSAGALSHLPVCRVKNPVDAILLMQQSEMRVVACSEKGTSIAAQADLKGGLCLLLGSEDKGIQPTLLRRCDAHVRIPQQGKVSSLNVSVAAGMLIYEVIRQRMS